MPNIEFGSTDPMRFRTMNSLAPSGVSVTPEKALGLPAVMECIRMASQNVASLPVVVFLQKEMTDRTPQYDTWQYELLTDMPFDPDNNKFNLMSDIEACVEGYGNAFVLKTKGKKPPVKNQVVKLTIIPPEQVKVKNVDGQKFFDVVGKDRVVVENLTTDDILHVRGFTTSGLMSGLSPIAWFRASLGNMIALQEFCGYYWANDATPAGYIKVDTRVDPAQAREILQIWEEEHGGVQNRGRPGILTGGAEWKSISMNVEDQAYVAANTFSVEEAARMMDWPAELLKPTTADTIRTEELTLRTLQFYLTPRLERIKAAFNADLDLFAGTPYMMDFQIDQFLRANIEAQSYHDLRMRQAGILTANEIRATKGYPALDDGNTLLPIPVGAAAVQTTPGNPEPPPKPGEGETTPSSPTEAA